MIATAFFAGYVCAATAGAGIVQAGFGLAAVARFASQRPLDLVDHPGVTLLKPLHGDEPLLEQALETAFAQDYGPLQIVFGVNSAADPALAVVKRLRTRYPTRDVAIVIDPATHGINHKISNVINMMRAANHDILVVSDSDVHAAPDYILQILAALRPGVGVVTTLYAGLPAHSGKSAALGASYISHTFLPGALLARNLGRRDCLGATMALCRSTLDEIGGFAALADHLADDAVLGHLVRRRGFDVAVAATVPLTTVPETTISALIAHEMRWARTVRSVAPLGHALSLLQFPSGWALLALILAGGAPWYWALLASVWIARYCIARAVDARLELRQSAPLWSIPLRDLLCIGEVLASYHGRLVTWRGHVIPVGMPTKTMRAPRHTPYRAGAAAINGL